MRIALALALLALPLSAYASLRKYHSKTPPFTSAATGACPRVDPSHVDNTQGYADGFSSGNCYLSIGAM